MLTIWSRKAEYYTVSKCLNHIYPEDHGNLNSGIESRKKTLSRGKNPKRHIPGRCTMTITIVIEMTLLNYLLGNAQSNTNLVNRNKRATI